ncbi:MAG: 3-oxoacyl-ACP reductase FabG [Candidatus Symbiothrix sp.]|jgi:NAD(P)-dependent dehydrogenase (short-subunit alcohol dehydrogenase family)|nr:3-oxoacyl-ACP reductase FabG [Candidatus Symbiothrix sp.]
MKLNKTVVITGGDKGIGKALVERMASLYEHVIFTYNTNESGAKHIMSQWVNTSALQCDLQDEEKITKLAYYTIKRFKKIDILINNAGYDDDAVFTKMNGQQWKNVLDINLYSIFYFTHQFVDQMIENNWGRVVNVTSIAGFTGAFGKSNYAAAKAGIVGFTKSLALELGSKGITVNAIAPGAIQTDMLKRIPEKYRNKILENIPSHRFGEPEEVADLVEFLVSDKATYINGQTIHINGGSYM